MPGVSREQIDRAKEVNILDYILQHEPKNVKRVGNTHYLKDHDSLRISNGLWKWESQGIGGKNVVDYLIKVRGYSFVDAVRHLAGEDYNIPRPPPQRTTGAASRCPPPEKKLFKLPPRNKDNERVIEYLQGRGIDKPLILDCIERGSVYESARWHNCVFVGRDDNGKARYATMRGTIGDFKRDADGSDKRFGFVLPPTGRVSDTVAVFESPVDALSHQVLYPGIDGWRLSLGCTALAALTNFLERHSEVKNCVVCVDNDDAGNRAAAKIAGIEGITVTRFVPSVGKDWNDELISIRNEVNPLEDVRKDIRFIDSRYNELFRIKDGDSFKFTAYDGEVKTLKCRHIDEAHIRVIGQYSDDFHICEFAEKMERVGNKYEAIPGQKPMLDVIAAKYGEPLQDVTIPMTEAAIKKLVGDRHTMEMIYYGAPEWKDKAYAAILRGGDGIAVLGVDGSLNDKLTSLHPYDAQRKKREIGIAESPKKQSLMGGLEEAKAEAAAHNATNVGINQKRTAHEWG